MMAGFLWCSETAKVCLFNLRRQTPHHFLNFYSRTIGYAKSVEDRVVAWRHIFLRRTVNSVLILFETELDQQKQLRSALHILLHLFLLEMYFLRLSHENTLGDTTGKKEVASVSVERGTFLILLLYSLRLKNNCILVANFLRVLP